MPSFYTASRTWDLGSPIELVKPSGNQIPYRGIQLFSLYIELRDVATLCIPHQLMAAKSAGHIAPGVKSKDLVHLQKTRQSATGNLGAGMRPNPSLGST